MANHNPEKTLTLTTNKSYIPFDFANLLTTEQVIEVYKEHEMEITEQEAIEISKFLHQWLEVLYLQFKRTNTLKNERKESNIVLPSEFRRAS